MNTIQLHKRDKEIIEYILRYRVATIYQIMRDLGFHYRRNLCGRLIKLANSGYLVSDWSENKKVYSIGRKGQILLLEGKYFVGSFKQQHLGNISSKTNHDIMLNDVYHAIESIESVQFLKTHNTFLLEESFNSQIRNIPDGSFIISANGIEKQIALELEISPKKKDHYHKILICYHEDGETEKIIYLVENHQIQQLILQVDKPYAEMYNDKIYVALVQDFLTDPIRCKFKSSLGKEFSFNSSLIQLRHLPQTALRQPVLKV